MAERSRYETTLTDEQVLALSSNLASLVQHPGWADFLELLRGARIVARETAFGRGREEFETWQGYISGLSDAGELPGQILAKAAELEAGAAQEQKVYTELRGLPMADEADVSFS